MQGTGSENKKTKHPGGSHHHPLNMVWKIRRGGRDGTNPSHTAKAFSSETIAYSRKSDGSHSSGGSSEKHGGQNGRDQSTKSGGSSRSANSKHSEVSDHHSATSGSSCSSLHASRSSDRRSLQNSDDKTPNRSHVDKSVRFNEIHIRDYERIVGDNPSCSSGPPIALGWAHGDTRILDVNSYEDSRPFRKERPVRIVLTREEREQILLNWGISFHEIIDSIRTNIKVKNQRRQTVTNLGKVERIEEAFESATRKLKRALLLRRRTGDKVKQLKEQSELASHTLASLKIAEDQALRQIRADQAPIQHEPEHDNLENLEVQVSVSDFCRISPVESKIQRSTSNLSEEDGASVISGFTLSNSTTASMREVERFYRDLELEMFGDTELPSMVGQTLEVPGLDIPPETLYYNDPPSVTGYSAEDGSNPSPKGYPTSSLDPDPYHSHMGIGSVGGKRAAPHPGDGHHSTLTTPLRPPHELHSLPQHRVALSDSVSPNLLYERFPHSTPQFCEQDDFHRMERFPSVKLSSSLDSCEMSDHYARGAVAAVEQQYLQMLTAPHPAIPSSSAIHFSSSHPYRPFGSMNEAAYLSNPTRNKYSSSPRPDAGGPQVRHVPPPTHLTPSHWMDDCEGPSIRRFEEPVTITEELYEPSVMLLSEIRQSNLSLPSQYDPARQPFPFSTRQPYD